MVGGGNDKEEERETGGMEADQKYVE